MGDAIGKIFSVLLAVLLLFLVPLINMFEQQDMTTREFVFSEATLFVDSVRNRGELTDAMFQELMNKLSATNNIYQVTLQHSHQSIVPVFSNPLDLSTFEERYEVHYDEYYTKDILGFIDSADMPYTMSQGDSFKISIINKNKTLGTQVMQILVGIELPTGTIVVSYGGVVK